MSPTQYILTKFLDLIVKIIHGDPSNETSVAENASAYVSAGVLSNTSPVWRHMLDPHNGFQQLSTEQFEGRELRVLELEDDDPEIVLILLRIMMHYQTRLTPKALTFEQLLDMAILCDKYDCADVVHPWSEFWIENLRVENQNYKNSDHEGWLRIAYTFKEVDGMDTRLSELSAKLLKTCCRWDSFTSKSFSRRNSSLKQDETVNETTADISTEYIPDPVLRYMWDKRASMVYEILGLLVRLYKDMQIDFDKDTFTPEHPLCRMPACVNLATGSLIRSLLAAGLPIVVPADISELENDSLDVLVGRLLNVRCETIVPWSFYTNLPLRERTISSYAKMDFTVKKWGPIYDLEAPITLTVPFTGSGPAYSVLSLHLPCPSSHVASPPSEIKGTESNNNGEGRCGIADRIQRFHEESGALLNKITGYKII